MLKTTILISVEPFKVLWVSDNNIISDLFYDCFEFATISIHGLNKVLFESKDFFKEIEKAHSFCSSGHSLTYNSAFFTGSKVNGKEGINKEILFRATLINNNFGQHDIMVSFIGQKGKLKTTERFKEIIFSDSKIQFEDRLRLLTKREIEVLKLIATGYITKEIGIELNLSIHTIDSHKQKLYQKLQVRNTAQLGVLAERMKILSC